MRLLPAFDEYLLGWKDREVAVPAEHRGKINRGGGWLHPVVLADGQIVATWRMKKESKLPHVDVARFAPLTPMVERAIAGEAKDIAEFLGVGVELGS